MDKVEEALFREKVRLELTSLALVPEINFSALGRAAGLSPTEMARARESGAGGLAKIQRLEARIRELQVAFGDPTPDGHDVEAEARIKSQVCPQCGETTPTHFDNRKLFYCGHCGEPLGRECSNCGHMNADPAAKFCTACGTPLTDEAIAQAAQDKEDLADATMTESQRRQQKKDAAVKRRRQRIKDGDEIDF